MVEKQKQFRGNGTFFKSSHFHLHSASPNDRDICVELHRFPLFHRIVSTRFPTIGWCRRFVVVPRWHLRIVSFNDRRVVESKIVVATLRLLLLLLLLLLLKASMATLLLLLLLLSTMFHRIKRRRMPVRCCQGRRHQL